MVKKEDIEQLIKPRMNRLLLVAETALPSSQFQAFRKIALDEFGKSGFGKDLEKLYGKDRKGTGRNRLDKEGVHHD